MSLLRKATAVGLSMLQLFSIDANTTHAQPYSWACLPRLASGMQRASFGGFFMKSLVQIGAGLLAALIIRIGIADAIETTESLLDSYYGNEIAQRLVAKHTFQQVLVWGLDHISLSAEEQMRLLTALSRVEGQIYVLEGHPSPPSAGGTRERPREPAQQALFHSVDFRASRLKLHGEALPLRVKPDPCSSVLISIPAGAEGIVWSGRSEDVTFWSRPEGGYDLYLRVTYKRRVGYVLVRYLEVLIDSVPRD